MNGKKKIETFAGKKNVTDSGIAESLFLTWFVKLATGKLPAQAQLQNLQRTLLIYPLVGTTQFNSETPLQWEQTVSEENEPLQREICREIGNWLDSSGWAFHASQVEESHCPLQWRCSGGTEVRETNGKKIKVKVLSSVTQREKLLTALCNMHVTWDARIWSWSMNPAWITIPREERRGGSSLGPRQRCPLVTSGWSFKKILAEWDWELSLQSSPSSSPSVTVLFLPTFPI